MEIIRKQEENSIDKRQYDSELTVKMRATDKKLVDYDTVRRE